LKRIKAKKRNVWDQGEYFRNLLTERAF